MNEKSITVIKALLDLVLISELIPEKNPTAIDQMTRFDELWEEK